MFSDILEMFVPLMVVFAIFASLRSARIIKIDEDSNKIIKFVTHPAWHILTFTIFLLFLSDRSSTNYLFPIETITTQYYRHGFYEGGVATFLITFLQYFWVLVGFGLSSRYPKRYVLYNLIIGLIILVVMNEWKNYELGI